MYGIPAHGALYALQVLAVTHVFAKDGNGVRLPGFAPGRKHVSTCLRADKLAPTPSGHLPQWPSGLGTCLPSRTRGSDSRLRFHSVRGSSREHLSRKRAAMHKGGWQSGLMPQFAKLLSREGPQVQILYYPPTRHKHGMKVVAPWPAPMVVIR